MLIIRLAMFKSDRDLTSWMDKVIKLGPVEITLRPVSDSKAANALAAARIKLKHYPKITKDQLVVVPPRERTVCEQAIEHFANIISVSEMDACRISSPFPCVAFVPEDENDSAHLAKAQAFSTGHVTRHTIGAEMKLDAQQVIAATGDRLDGVALLAEAMSHRHATGKFHELVRVLERAFGVGGHRLIAPTTRYFEQSEYGYTEEEIKRWVLMRDGVSHADKRKKILFESDVAWLVPRLTQAAYDVVLNKKRWRSSDVVRRRAWVPTAGTSSVDGDLFLIHGQPLDMRIQLFDEYRRFPANLNAKLNSLPADWWAKHDGSSTSLFGGPMQILPAVTP